jgi:SAM-dependent methyltransferase
MEEIGKVRLDYEKYSGKDLYCDGAVEDELLDIVKNNVPGEYGKIIEERKSWPILYHLSSLRENIVDWIPMSGGRADSGKGKDVGGAGASHSPSDGGSLRQEKTDSTNGGKGRRIHGTGAKVLEVGSGCGAITGALARRAGTVTCVELSKKRSQINAYRNKCCDNVTIHVGNFKDIEPALPMDYDYIFLIGVFEYARSYMEGDTPYEDFLKILLKHLAPEGRILIAIENRYGLKYFAGCKEDHLGTYFSGIENYEAGGGVRTFSREGLEGIFLRCGVEEWHFYYPYPDYKFMTALYSDEYQPKKGELCTNLRNFDRDRMLLFDEKHAFDGLVEDGLFPVFANSYLAVVGKGFDTKYVKYSNDRAPEYAIRTEIVAEDRSQVRRYGGICVPGSEVLAGRYGMAPGVRHPGTVCVRKYPMSPAAQEHVRGMAAACESLTERYRGGNLEINRCVLVEDEKGLYAQFEFVQGTLLSELMDRCLERDDCEGFHQYFRQYVERIGYHSEYPAADFDLAFSNILVSTEENIPLEGGEAAERWTLIDYEWTFGRAIDTKELAYRAVYCYLLEDAKRSKMNPELVLKELGITEATACGYQEQERDFQHFVTGERLSMGEMRERIGYRTIVPQKWIDKYEEPGQIGQVQIYEDRGGGYSEEQSYFIKDAYQGESRITLKLQVGADVKKIRIDPGMCPCAVKIREMTFEGEEVPLYKKKVLAANGRVVRGARTDVGGEYPCIVFATDDPNISIALGEKNRKEQGILSVRLEVIRLPLDMAQDLAEGKVRGLFGA